MPNNELQELLSARFERYTHPTNESVWTAIEAQLDGEKSDRAGFWFWFFNGITAAILVGAIVQSTISSELVATSPKSQHTERSSQGEVRTDPKEANVSNQTRSANINESRLNVSQNESKTIRQQLGEVEISSLTETKRKVRNESIEARLEKSTTESQLKIQREIQREIDYGDITPLETRSLLEFIDQEKISDFFSLSASKNKLRFFRELPIHLGFEFTYLHRTGRETDFIGVIDTGYTFANGRLANNRHFEFSLFSQFDFTQRFSTSVGIGYSSSKSLSMNGTPTPAYIASGEIESLQRIVTIPLQVKFALIQKNRFVFSAGLTFQGEFGQTMHLETEVAEELPIGLPSQFVQESKIVTKVVSQHVTMEPFVQFSIGVNPRIRTFANVGYRSYLWQTADAISPSLKKNYFLADFGLQFRIN